MVEAAQSLPEALVGAAETLNHGGIDMVHFRLDRRSEVARTLELLTRHGFKLFVPRDGSFKPGDTATLVPGRYLAVRDRALSGGAKP